MNGKYRNISLLLWQLISYAVAASQDTFIWRLTGVSESKDKDIVVSVKGLLQVRRNQEPWKMMCYQWTDDNVKNVACQWQQLDQLKDAASILSQNFSCPTGNEQNFTFCTRPAPSTDTCQVTVVTASVTLAVEVTCNTSVGLLGLHNVELQGGDAHSGTLEYTRDGKKMPVCYDNSNAESVASVVCKQMGHSDNIKVSSVASNATEFASLECLGSEQTLDACTFKIHVSSCTPSSVVAVECKLDMSSQNLFDVRLSSPDRSPSQGTVEVWKYGYWGVICDNDWTTHDADVVCRQLGYSKAIEAPKNAMYGQGTGVVFWDRVSCTENESSIADCPHSTAVVSATCDSTKAAGVTCDTSNPLTSNYICTNGMISVPAGDSFLRFPDGFSYESGTTCSCESSLNASTTISLYIQKKMFKENHKESLTFYDNSSPVEQLYGNDSSAGPYSFTNTDNFTIQFKSDTSAGEGRLNIQIKASDAVAVTCTKTIVTTTQPPSTTAGYT